MIKTAWLLPGHGSQFIGMGYPLYREIAEIKNIFEEAEDLSQLPLRKICFEGPESLLMEPIVLDPALCMVNLAYVWFLNQEGLYPDVVAGYSAGEITALYCAGVYDLHRALTIAVYRGRILQKVSREIPGVMTAIYHCDADFVENCVLRLQVKGYIDIAAWNAPRHVIVAGREDLVWEMEKRSLQVGAQVSRIGAKGPWHTPVLKDATKESRSLLAEIPFNHPVISIFMNRSGMQEQRIASIRSCLAEQISNPVKWYQVMESLESFGISDFIEVGPGKVLRGLFRYLWKDLKDYRFHSLGRSKLECYKSPFSMDSGLVSHRKEMLL